MGKLFLYGRTESKNRIDPYAKLTVNCPPNIVVRAESIDSLARLDVHSGDSGRAVFEKLEQGDWNITFADVMYPPSQLVAISGLDFEITLEPTARMMYAMRRPAEPEVEYSISGVEESFSAVIQVIYPEGSVCTCSNADTVLSASDNNGYYEFVVPYFGEWIITCADGKHSRSKTVSILDNGQTEEVVLDYTTYLYKDSVGCVAWNTKDNNDSIGTSYITAAKQDLSNADMLYVECIPSAAVPNSIIVCIRDNNDEVDNFEEDCLAYAQQNSEDGTLEIDVSNFSGLYFIEIFYSGTIDSVYYL